MGTRGRSHHSEAHLVSRALLALTGLVALSLAACTATGSQGPGLATNQVLSWAYVNATAVLNPKWDVAVLDPAVITNAIDSSNIAMIYTGLVTLNSSTLQIEPDAAQSISVSPDGKEYTFVLKRNLFFSDGSPITARTFAYSIDRAIGPTTSTGQSLLCSIDDSASYGATNNCASPGAYYLGLIDGAQTKTSLTPQQASNYSLIGSCDATHTTKGLDVIDARTLRICIAHPAAYFLDALDYPTSFPVEQSLIQKYPNGLWVNHLDEGGCSGPFRVKSYKPGAELDFIPNPYWKDAFGKNLTLTEVDRPFLKSQDTEYGNYRAGSYDFTDVPPDDYTFAVGQSDFHQVASLFIDYFGVNFHQPPFDNLDVRQAFDLALNKQLLVDRVFNGGAIPTNHIVPQGMPGFDSNLSGPDGSQSVTGNQTKAVQLLNDARSHCTPGVPVPDYCPYIDGKTPQQDLKIQLSAGSGTDASQQELASIATETWSQVLSLNVSINAFPDLNAMEGQLFAVGGNTAQLWQIAWIADYPDPQDWLSLQFHTNALYNLESVHSPAMDALMDSADANQNPAQRMTQYNQVEQYMVNQVAWIPFDQEKTSWRLRPWVQGFGLNPLLIMEDVDWPNVSIEAH